MLALLFYLHNCKNMSVAPKMAKLLQFVALQVLQIIQLYQHYRLPQHRNRQVMSETYISVMNLLPVQPTHAATDQV